MHFERRFTMEINYKISREELINFHISHFKETKIYKKAMTKQFILVTLIIILTTILFQKLYLFALLILLCGVLSLSRKKDYLFYLEKN